MQERDVSYCRPSFFLLMPKSYNAHGDGSSGDALGAASDATCRACFSALLSLIILIVLLPKRENEDTACQTKKPRLIMQSNVKCPAASKSPWFGRDQNRPIRNPSLNTDDTASIIQKARDGRPGASEIRNTQIASPMTLPRMPTHDR